MTLLQSKRMSIFLPLCLLVSTIGLVSCAQNPLAQNPIYSRLTGGGGKFNQAWTPGEKCKVLHNWVRQFEHEFPRSSRPGGPKMFMRNAKAKAIYGNLYRDEYFVPVFGTPIDQMGQNEKNSVSKLISFNSPCFFPRTYEEASDFQTFAPMMQLILDKKFPGLVAKARPTQKWKEQTLADIKAAPPTEETWEKIIKSRKEGEQILTNFWPSEQKIFFETLQNERLRIVEGVLVARIDKVSAMTPSFERLKQLDEVVYYHPEQPFGLVPDPVKDRETKRAAKAFQEGLSELLAKEWEHFEKRGTGLAAVKNGATWYKNFSRFLGFDLGSPEEDFLRRFQQQRESDVAASADALMTLFASAKTIKQLRDLKREYYIDYIDDDAPGENVKSIFELIRFAERKLDFEKVKWQYSAREISLMETPGHVKVPAQYEPPTAEEIRLALLRAFQANGNRIIDPHTVAVRVGRDLLPGLRIPLGEMNVSNVTIDKCSLDREGGYTCRYKVAYTKGNFGSGESISDKLVLTTRGWHSESAINRISERDQQTAGKIIKDVGSALPRPGCMGRKALLNPLCRE